MLAATETAPGASAAPAPAPAAPQVYIPQTWGEVFDSQKAFVAAATPVMAVFFGILTAVVTAAKCPGVRQAGAAPAGRSERVSLAYARKLVARGTQAARAGWCPTAHSHLERLKRAEVSAKTHYKLREPVAELRQAIKTHC
jgi:hypothetical protein